MTQAPVASAQESTFMNATLQGLGNGIAISIATFLNVPDEVTVKGEADTKLYIKEMLSKAAENIPGLTFEVQIGPDDQQ